MHHKFMVIDGETLFTGSYNLSDNAEHETFENMLVFKGPDFAAIVKAYEADFEAMWKTRREELPQLMETVKTAATVPIVFEPIALSWSEVTTLKQAIRASCPDVDSEAFRTEPDKHYTCNR